MLKDSKKRLVKYSLFHQVTKTAKSEECSLFEGVIFSFHVNLGGMDNVLKWWGKLWCIPNWPCWTAGLPLHILPFYQVLSLHVSYYTDGCYTTYHNHGKIGFCTDKILKMLITIITFSSNIFIICLHLNFVVCLTINIFVFSF